MAAVAGYTWDGLPVAPDAPHGAAILVRQAATGRYLILHRAHRGPRYEGEWAWTPPSGSRQPGEPLLAAALRELAEETGLPAAATDLRALDLSGTWAHFGVDVPAGAEPRLDAEHDRFEWLSAAQACARCRPGAVADGIRLAESAIAAELTFRPVAVGRHVAAADGRDIGVLEHCYVTGESAVPDAVGISYAIDGPGFPGQGLGPQLIWSYVRDVVLPAHPGARHVVVRPDVSDAGSLGAVQKAGFTVPEEPGSDRVCVLDIGKFFGREA